MANTAYSNFIQNIKKRHFYKTTENGGKRETALPPENNLFILLVFFGIPSSLCWDIAFYPKGRCCPFL